MGTLLLKEAPDQADGLRRLMARDRGRLVAVVGSHRGAGATSVALELAMALWQLGKDVVVVDEHGGTRSACSSCRPQPRSTWAEVAAGRVSLAEGAGQAWGALPVLPAQPDRTPAADDPHRALAGRIVLVDARRDAAGALSRLARAADDIIVVLQPQPDSLRAAYACIKTLHHAHAVQQLHVLLTHVADADAAQQVVHNLALTGSRYLALSVQAAGCIRADAYLPQARNLGLGVVQAFPAAAASADLRRIAADLLHWPLRTARPSAAAAAPTQPAFA